MQIIEEAKKRGQEKAKKTKSMIVLDVKPWDDTTGTQPFFPSGLLGACVMHISRSACVFMTQFACSDRMTWRSLRPLSRLQEDTTSLSDQDLGSTEERYRV